MFQASFEKLRTTYHCGICLEVMVTPIITPCHHSFCQLCIHKHLEGKRSIHVKCPICNGSGLTKRSLRRDHKTEAILKAMQTLADSASRDLNLNLTQRTKGQKTPSQSMTESAKVKAEKDDPELFSSPERTTVQVKGRRAARKKSNSPANKKSAGPKILPGKKTVRQSKRSKVDVKRDEDSSMINVNNLLDYLKSDSDIVSEVSESFTDPEVTEPEPLDVVQNEEKKSSNPAQIPRNCVSMKSILDIVKEQAQAPPKTDKKRKVLEDDSNEASLSKSEKNDLNTSERGDEGSSSLSIHNQPVKPSRLASKKRRTKSKSTERSDFSDSEDDQKSTKVEPLASKSLSVVPDHCVDTRSTQSRLKGKKLTKSNEDSDFSDGENNQKSVMVGPSSSKPSPVVPNDDVDTRSTRSRQERKKSSILKSSLLENERQRPSQKKKPSKKVMFVRLGPLSKRHLACPKNLDLEPKLESYKKQEDASNLEKTCDRSVPTKSGDQAPKPTRTNSFMADIIGNDKDVYSSDEETPSQENIRVKRMRENNSIVKELSLQDGRLRAKRSRILPVYSSNESSEDASSQAKLIQDPPIKDRTNLLTPKGTGNAKQKSMSTYLQSKRSSFVSMPSKDDFSHVSKQSEEDLVDLISHTPDQDENMASVVPQPQLGRLELKPVVAGEHMTREDTTEFIGNTVDIGIPSKRSRFSSSTVSTEDTNNSDGSTQAIEEKIRKMKEILPIQEPCQDSNIDKTPEKGVSHVGQVLESDDDLFESTPQAPTSSRLRETKRSRMTDQTKSDRDPRKQLEYPDPDPFLDDNGNNAIDMEEQIGDDEDLPSSQVLTTSIYAAQDLKVIPDNEARKIVLITSGLDVKSRELVKRFVLMSGCTLKVNMDKSITHVIVAHDEDLQAEVTLKFLQGVSLGKFLIGIQWIRDCCEKEKVLDYRDYEVKHSSGEDGPFRSRMAHEENQPLLFQDFAFILKGKFQTIPEDKFRELLQWNGGKIWRSPVTINNEDRGKRFILLDRQSPHVESECVKLFRSTGMVVVEKDWIIDCLAQYSILSFLPFMLHPSIGSVELQKEGYHSSMMNC